MKYLLTLIAILLLSFSPANLKGAEIDTSTICKIIGYDNTVMRPISYVGTGFVYNEDESNYYIMTNGHVIKRVKSGLYLSFYKDSYMTSLVPCNLVSQFYKEGTTLDVAVVSIKKDVLPYEIKPLIVDYSEVPVNSLVFGAGYPSGYWMQQWVSRVIPDEYANITKITMGPVNAQSGSPVFIEKNGKNYVVGMVTYRFGNGISPAKFSGGYIDMAFIKQVTSGKPIMAEKVSASYTLTAEKTETQSYFIVNSDNKIMSYYTYNGEKYPWIYNEGECQQVQLPPEYVFCPAEEHPYSQRYPILDRLPTINLPKKPLFPPFNKKQKFDTNPKAPKKDSLWPQGAPDLTPKSQFHPIETEPIQPEKEWSPDKDEKLEAEKPKVSQLELDRLKQKLAATENNIQHAIDKQKKLSSDALSAERRVHAERQKEYELERKKLQEQIKILEIKLAEKPKERPKPIRSLFGKVIGGFKMVPEKISGAFDFVTGGITSNGIFWTLLLTGGSLLIPGVRAALIARGVSPVLIKVADVAVKMSKWAIEKKMGKNTGGIVSGITDKIKDKVSDDVHNLVGDNPNTIDIPDYNNVQLTDPYSIEPNTVTTVSKEISENGETSLDSSKEQKYNPESETLNWKVNRTIKEIVDRKTSNNGKSLQELSYLGHLYQEGVRKLKNNELKDINNAPIQGYKESADAVDRWVKMSFVNKVSRMETRNIDNDDYLYAYRGMLYKEGVELLRKGWFTGVLNYDTSADAVERWVEDLLYEKLTRNI